MLKLAAGSDTERSAAPVRTRFIRNLIWNEDGRDTFTVYDDVSGISFAENVINAVDEPVLSEGFSSERVEMIRAKNGLLYPRNPTLDDVGVSSDITPITRESAGVGWYPKAGFGSQFGTGQVIEVSGQPGALMDAVKSASGGDTLRLTSDSYLVSKIIEIDKPLTIVSGEQARIEFERSTLFEITDGGGLFLKGLKISGSRAPDYVGNSVIRTSRYSMLHNYVLRIEDSEFDDLDVNRFFNVLSVSKSTFADRIEISNSSFTDVSGSVLGLDKEVDDYGIYNAEYVSIDRSSFARIQGPLIRLYRGGSDESTFGPHFTLTDSRLEDVGRGGRNKSEAGVSLHGVQVADLSGNTIKDSAPIKVSHTVSDPITTIRNNRFIATSPPVIEEVFYVDRAPSAIIEDNHYQDRSD